MLYGGGDDHSLLAGAAGDDPLLAGGDVLSGELAVPDDRFLPDADPPEVAADGDQLVLSFRGQMFVFDSVPIEKVQALLLMLGGKEVPSGLTSKAAPVSHDNRVSTYVSESLKTPFPESCNNPHRIASLQRFREKRKNRCFEKKVQYTVRSEVASRIKRHKGQFASSKVNSLESASGGLSCDLTERTQEKELPAFCQNCGISKDATPMMRRGPAGPKSLCNACGLTWTSKGSLKDVQRASTSKNLLAPINQVEHVIYTEATMSEDSLHEKSYMNCLPRPLHDACL